MEKLIEVLRAAKPQADIAEILAANDLYGQGIIDSMDIMVILDEACAAFNFEIDVANVQREDFQTLESIYALIRRCGGV